MNLHIFKMIPLTLLLLIALILIFALIILAYSPGKPRTLMNSDGIPVAGSLSEKLFIDLGGVRQGMIIQSRDTANPVLLYLHGGMPEYFLNEKHPALLEEMFTVVWWEQRGSGISSNREVISQPVTTERLIGDVLELSDYLRRRFGKDKIYLMGHSGGTFIGIQAAARAPEMFNAYIGVAQMVYQFRSEKLAYDYMLNEYELTGQKAMARKLKRAAITDSIPDSYLKIRDKAMHELGIGTMHNMKSVITGIFFPSLFCTAYTLPEKFNLWASKARSGVSPLWHDMISANLNQEISVICIPVYFCSGIYDYTVNYNISWEYYNTLKAPVKGFYTFENSAHSPNFEEPGKMLRILREDVLKGKNALADNDR